MKRPVFQLHYTRLDTLSADTLLRITTVPEGEGKRHSANMLVYTLTRYRINISSEQHIFHSVVK
jgi:hypothetical protein